MSIPDNAIAVVGMAGKFPGANDLSTFWSNLRSGKESIVTLSEPPLGLSSQTTKAKEPSLFCRRRSCTVAGSLAIEYCNFPGARAPESARIVVRL